MAGKKTKSKKRSGAARVSKPRSKASSKRTTLKSSAKRKQRSPILGFIRFWLVRVVLVLFVMLLGFTVYLDVSIRKKFEGQKWALPAHVYTRPMELYIGQKLDHGLVQSELAELGYVARDRLERVGSYQSTSRELAIYQREFRFWDGLRPQQKIRLSLSDDVISNISVESPDGAKSDTEIVRLEPRLFGSVSPMSHEDRSLLRIEDVPQELVDGYVPW